MAGGKHDFDPRVGVCSVALGQKVSVTEQVIFPLALDSIGLIRRVLSLFCI